MKTNIYLAMLSACLILASCSGDSEDPVITPGNLDCNGVEDGTSILDDCGDCQQAYIYNFVTHVPTLLDDTSGVVLGPTDMLVMPNDPGNPYWNAGCTPVPPTYSFDRMGQSTVSFGGQTARLQMAIELYGAFSTASEAELLEMYNDGTGFSDPVLNSSGKKLGNKTAAYHYSSLVKPMFDAMLSKQANVVMPAVNAGTIAAPGVAGEYTGAGGRSVKVDEKGFELNQTFIKGLIGALCVDQMVNGYLSPSKLDPADNDPSGLGAGEYTTMEHYWDEGFGYLYGLEADITAPTLSGNGSVLLNKYAGKVNTAGDVDMNAVYDALKAGRTAIVNMDYTERDAQGLIARELVSKILGVKASDYLRGGAAELGNANPDMAEVIHDLSEGYGFVLSLQFARGADGQYLVPKADVDAMLANLEAGNGLWDIDAATLISMADQIDAAFGL